MWGRFENFPPDEEGTAAAKRGRGGQTLTILPVTKVRQFYDLPALTSFGRPLLVRRGIPPPSKSPRRS
jgi:hypothetical protein